MRPVRPRPLPGPGRRLGLARPGRVLGPVLFLELARLLSIFFWVVTVADSTRLMTAAAVRL